MKNTINQILSLLVFLTLMSTSSVQSQEITMFSGLLGFQFYEDDVRISKDLANSLIAQNELAHQSWQKADRHSVYSVVAAAAQFGFLYWSIYSINNGDDGVTPMVGFLASTGLSIGFGLSSNKHRKESILAYNAAFDESHSMNVGPTYNGLGLVYVF